jgi:hypothetical protein
MAVIIIDRLSRTRPPTQQRIRLIPNLLYGGLEAMGAAFEFDAPLCPKCAIRMKLLTLVPGREFNNVHYRCEGCAEKALRSVPRGR